MSNYEKRGVILIFQAIYVVFFLQALLVFSIVLYALFSTGTKGFSILDWIKFLVITAKLAILYFIIYNIGTQNKSIPKKICIAAAAHGVTGIIFSLFFLDPLVNFPNIIFHNLWKPFTLSIMMHCLLFGIVYAFFNNSEKAKSFYKLT